MANYLTVGGLTSDPYGTIGIQASNPLTGGTFGGWDAGTSQNGLGSNVFIDTPNVSTIPASTVANNACNGERSNCGVVLQDGGSEAGNINSGIAGSLTTVGGASAYVGYIIDDNWTAQNGAFAGDAATWGNPTNNNGDPQTYPGNLTTSNDLYSITMLSWERGGEPQIAEQGFRISYNASVGNLVDTLLKIAPPASGGFPSNIFFGRLDVSQNDEQAAAVWLAFGYGLFKGNGTNTIPAFWTTT